MTLSILIFLKRLTRLITDYCSKKMRPSSVPQGSNLGPLLFTIFINDATDAITSSRILLYADDIKLFRSINTNQDTEALQRDLDALVLWSEKNHLPFNLGKFEKMTFSRKKKNEIETSYVMYQTTLKKTDCVRDVGITLDKKMTSSTLIQELLLKVRKTMGFIIRNSKHFENMSTLQILYFA